MLTEAYDPLKRLRPKFTRHDAGIVSGNERRLLSLVWRTPQIPRAALTKEIGLTQQSVHRLVGALHEDGLLLFGPLVPPEYKGKPSPALLLNPRFGCSLGVSVDTDVAGIACMDFAGGHVSRRISIAGLSRDRASDRIRDATSELLAASRFTEEDIIGLGFAISGFRMEGDRYNPPIPLAEWAEVPLAQYAADTFDIATWAENGANTAALCEAMFGAGHRFSDFAYLSFNYGFGAGFIVNGELLAGGFGNAGELGGMFDDHEMDVRPALQFLLGRLNAAGRSVSTIEDLSKDCDENDPVVRQWLDDVEPYHNRVINVLSSTMDPQAIILGGQMPKPIAEALIRRSRFFGKPRHGVYRQVPVLEISRLGTESSAIGAACLPLKECVF